MSGVLAIDIPEQGQLVEVRQRRYAVASVVPSTLPNSIYPNGIERPQHLVTLAVVKKDGVGVRIQHWLAAKSKERARAFHQAHMRWQ